MKLLHVLCQQPGKTGSGVFLQAITHHAAKVGHEQRVVIGIPASHGSSGLSSIDERDIFPVRFETERLPFPVAGMSDIMPYPSTRFSAFTDDMRSQYLAAFGKALLEATQDYLPDVIHSHHLWLVTALCRRMFEHIPLVVNCHSTEFRQMERAPHLLAHVLADCRRVDRVFALHSEQAREIASRYGIDPAKIDVVGAGYREEVFCPAEQACLCSETGTIEIAYAGKISRPKGVPFFIEALNHVAVPEGYRVRVRLAGSSGDASLKQIPNELDRKDISLDFLGLLSQRELAEVFRSAHLLVLPSFYEGLPLVVVEALASGCRVVTTDLPSLDSWLPERLDAEGVVERVPLPRLRNVDEPYPEDIPVFVDRMARAVERQMQRIVEGPLDWDSCVKPCIGLWGWASVYRKIEAIYRNPRVS
ncbi:glycosyltransferase [Desulfatirhabdium butyrativorans]|uniref:glycosyltransferase n=1 Tax=Desulfatirhabdium butyrativorans TaxID=340467 RepID=UPI0003F73D6D|nr:glycosyltransferase [Desulfatirhabdium butyrativorans]